MRKSNRYSGNALYAKKDTEPDTEEFVNLDEDDSSAEGSGPRIKRRPGETKDQAIQRIEKAKEL